jgi:hypothetical protein
MLKIRHRSLQAVFSVVLFTIILHTKKPEKATDHTDLLVQNRSNAEIVGSTPTQGRDVCPLFCKFVYAVWVQALQRAYSHPISPNKRPKGFVISEIILNSNRPQGRIREKC